MPAMDAQIKPQAAAPVVVDDREHAGGLIRELAARLGPAVRVERLAVGDARVGDKYLIERKTAADLVATLLDGRFESQMSRLRAAAAPPMRPLVILEGAAAPAALAGLDPNDFRAALLRIQLDWGIAVLASRDVEETARWIELLSRRGATGGAAHLPFAPERAAAGGAPGRRHDAAPLRGTEALQLAALRQAPGLGAAKARALLEHFGSMNAIRAASAAQIAALPGIGAALAQALKRHLSRG